MQNKLSERDLAVLKTLEFQQRRVDLLTTEVEELKKIVNHEFGGKICREIN